MYIRGAHNLLRTARDADALARVTGSLERWSVRIRVRIYGQGHGTQESPYYYYYYYYSVLCPSRSEGGGGSWDGVDGSGVVIYYLEN